MLSRSHFMVLLLGSGRWKTRRDVGCGVMWPVLASEMQAVAPGGGGSLLSLSSPPWEACRPRAGSRQGERLPWRGAWPQSRLCGKGASVGASTEDTVPRSLQPMQPRRTPARGPTACWVGTAGQRRRRGSCLWRLQSWRNRRTTLTASSQQRGTRFQGKKVISS